MVSARSKPRTPSSTQKQSRVLDGVGAKPNADSQLSSAAGLLIETKYARVVIRQMREFGIEANLGYIAQVAGDLEEAEKRVIEALVRFSKAHWGWGRTTSPP
jgi:hypothetical protein